MEGEREDTMSKLSVKWFSELSINSKEIAGEKASYLSEAYNKKNFSKNVSIPAGFVITKDAIESFFAAGNIKNAIANIFSETDKNNLEELKSASSKIKNLIMKTQFPSEIEEGISEAYENLSDDLGIGEGLAYDILSNATEPAFVAVRASYRNELGDSYFNIKGKANIIYSIKRIISSLFNTDVILEEINSGIKPEDICTAIIIQKMIQADKSGIVYSGDTIITNAIWGLGGGLKLDEVGKDEYLAERSFRIIGKEVGEKKYAITRESSGSLKLVGLKEGYSFMQVLEEHEVQELCNVLLRLDDIFGEKTQFEFAMTEGEISIVKIGKVEKKEVVVASPVIESEIETLNPVLTNSEVEIEIEDVVVSEPVIVGSTVELTTEPIVEPTTEEVSDIVTQTKIDVLITNNTLGENANPTNARSGFLTLENIIKASGVHPANYIENFNTKGYGEVIFNGLQMNVTNLNEIWVRLSDFTNEEFKNLEGAKEESQINPIMGLNGIRYLLTNPELLKRELKAISKLKVENNSVGVMIPKISSVYELKKVKEIIESLDVNLKVGIVLETPASIQLIKDFIEEGIDAVVFNGDTLTEYLLAIDSKNPLTYKFYDDTNPALMYQLEYVIRVCNRKNVKTSFVGSATNKKEMIDYLVRKNINTIIVAPEKIAITTALVYDAEEEFIHGTDKEKRQYEMNVEKDRQKKELLEFEAAKEEEMKKKIVEDSSLSQEEVVIPKVSKEAREDKSSFVAPDVSEDIKLIKEEKNEFLENGKEVQMSESLVIHPENMKIEKPDNVEEAMRLIDEHNNQPAVLSGVELAMKEIDEHDSEEEIISDEKENIDSVVSDDVTVSDSHEEAENKSEGNVDLVESNEELEEVPEDLYEIDRDLKEKKIMNDIELIESEKREYLENSNNDGSLQDSEDTRDSEELKENVESIPEKKDVLGIF